MKTSAKRSSKSSGGLTRLLLVFFFVIAVAPVAWGFCYALAYSFGLVGLLSHGFTLEHWRSAFSSSELWLSFGYSFYIAAATVAITLVASLAMGLALRPQIARGPLAHALYAPLALPPMVAALFIFQMLSGAGLLARVAFHFGWIHDPADFPRLVYDPAGCGIMLAHALLAIPFFVLLFRQLYENEKLSELTALSQTLGAGRWACLWRLTLPILLRRASANITLLFIGVFGSFEIAALLGPQAPPMISLLTRRKFSRFDLTQKPEAYIIAAIYTALVLALIAWAFRKRESADAA